MKDKDKQDILLKEYELCQSYANSVESSIWQAGSVIGIGTIGVLSLLLTIRTKLTVEIFCGIGFFLVWLIQIWRSLNYVPEMTSRILVNQ